MRNIALVTAICVTFSVTFSNGSNNCFSYTDPLPGAENVSIKTGIILRPLQEIDISGFISKNVITIEGTLSGRIEFRIIPSDDNRTVILRPYHDFKNGEQVTVKLGAGLVTLKGKSVEPFSYSFKTSVKELEPQPLIGLVNELTAAQISALTSGNNRNNIEGDFPNITVSYSDQPTPGYLFMTNVVFDQSIPNISDLIILNNTGSPYYYRTIGNNAFNFDKQPNGMLTYFDLNKAAYYELNNSYNLVDSFRTGNGYTTDLHELRLLPNGHALILSYDPKTVDMSQIYPGGNPFATVVGLIIQELDAAKNVVFQWRSWDHFNILDATHEDFTSYYVDYVHGNALEVDNDGNILLSSRHMDEITKINRQTGDIIWRLGGKHNEFTFTNDPEKFSHQHAIRRIANGNITMFDNGNFHSPPHSRAVEYSLDEVNKTISLVWQYRNTPDIYGYAMGYVQRLPDNNTLICWGSTNPTVTEVKYNGTKEYELSFDQNVFSYRVYRYQWQDSLTGITPVSSVAETFSLSQNYPNPFNPSTRIKFDVPPFTKGGPGGFVSLNIYNPLGQQVAVLVDQQLQPGKYEITWDASEFPSGVYYYKLYSGEFSESKKMILIK